MKRPSSAVAMENSTVIRVARSLFQRVLESDPGGGAKAARRNRQPHQPARQRHPDGRRQAQQDLTGARHYTSSTAVTRHMVRRPLPAAGVAGDAEIADEILQRARNPDVIEPAAAIADGPVGGAIAPPGVDFFRKRDRSRATSNQSPSACAASSFSDSSACVERTSEAACATTRRSHAARR